MNATDDDEKSRWSLAVLASYAVAREREPVSLIHSLYSLRKYCANPVINSYGPTFSTFNSVSKGEGAQFGLPMLLLLWVVRLHNSLLAWSAT